MKESPVHPLQRALTDLRAELARSTRLDERSRAGLHAALTDVETRLRGKGAADKEPAAPHGLDSLAVGFEAEHPALAASLRQFIELLGQAGL